MPKQHLSRTYAFRRLSDSTDPDYAAALNIYVTGISPDIRTNSNEITFWLDRTYAEYGDEFVVCTFYSDRKVIGFSQLAFLRAERLLFFDYVVLHKEHRSHGEYFQFARMLQEWVDEQGFEFDYAVAEVSYELSGAEPSEHSVLLVELFKQIGFGVVHCNYFQPPLGDDNPQSDMRAHLLVSSRERVKTLKRATLLHIVRAIYFQHYERWYTAFLPQISDYRNILNDRMTQLERGISDARDITVNGVRLLHPPNLPSRSPKAAQRIGILQPLVVIFAFGIFCGVFFFLQARLQLPWQIVALLFTASLIVFATAFGLFNKDARQILDTFIEAIKDIVGKRK